MTNILPLEECSIYDLFINSGNSKSFSIPIYQRNYAWEEDEIGALIEDVHNAFRKDKHSVYYIGTLVTYKRNNDEYEVIDGQQRLTTIFLILKRLEEKCSSTLTYSARSISARTLKQLPNPDKECDKGILNGYDAIGKKIKDIEKFKDYFLNNVHIIHYHVPKDIDLNHYFEVMNSRGKQLEMHEIIKARLMQHLCDEDKHRLSRVWDACSDMNSYIQRSLQDETIFGSNLSDFEIDNFSQIPAHISTSETIRIIDLINTPIEMHRTEANFGDGDNFQSIIDFPNFMLIVLKLTILQSREFGNVSIPLNDKDLLNTFSGILAKLTTINEKVKFAKEYTFNLLKAKYLLDNYLVHHSVDNNERAGNNPWELKRYTKENKRIALSQTTEIQDELVHLLSMLEVTFTAKQHKNYLLYCLIYLFDNFKGNGYDYNYLEFLRKLADKFFHDVYLNEDGLSSQLQPSPDAFDKMMIDEAGGINTTISQPKNDKTFKDIYKMGRMDIPLYIFNYTDYKLWMFYVNHLKGETIKSDSEKAKRETIFKNNFGCSDFGLEFFDSFYFSRTRKSLEHFYPQAKAVRYDEKAEDNVSTSGINRFGNFAMISSDMNSSGKDWDPKTKLDHYLDTKSNPVSVASPKFRIMMQICKDNSNREQGKEWNADDIERHENHMLGILFPENNP